MRRPRRRRAAGRAGRSARALTAALAFGLACTACPAGAPDARADADTPSPADARPRDAAVAVDLVRSGGWTLLAPADDPWSAHLDPAHPCDPLGLRDEGTFFEIDTRVCGAASVAQPIGAPITRGDALHLLVWHLDLAADPPATGHVAVSVDGHLLLDEEVPIPSQERVYEVRRAADFDAPAGARAVFHVHNHGFNNWRLAYLRGARGE